MILVTGATGNVGRCLVEGLRAARVPVRALVRDPAAARLPEDVEMVRGDLRSTSSLAAAAQGCDAAFLLWPFMDTNGAHEVCSTLSAHCGRVVLLSSEASHDDVGHLVDASGAEPSAFHDELERLVVASAREWTVLRPTGFAVNALLWQERIRNEGVVRWPFGAARRSLIHEDDIAQVAVRALTEDGLRGARPVISGPEAVRQDDQVRAIGEAVGRPVRWVEQSRDEAREELLARGWGADFLDGALDAWEAMIARPERVTSAVEEIIGRPARSFRSWAEDHVDDFR